MARASSSVLQCDERLIWNRFLSVERYIFVMWVRLVITFVDMFKFPNLLELRWSTKTYWVTAGQQSSWLTIQGITFFPSTVALIDPERRRLSNSGLESSLPSSSLHAIASGELGIMKNSITQQPLRYLARVERYITNLMTGGIWRVWAKVSQTERSPVTSSL